VSRLARELTRVFGDPLVPPRAVVRVQVGSGQGLAAGREEADRLVDAGADLVVLDADVPGTAPLAALAVLLDLEPVAVVGTVPVQGWREQVLAVRDAVRSARPHVGDPALLVAELGDPALARVAGLLEQLGARRTPVLVGGGTAAAAGALLAHRLLPGAERWWLAGSAPLHPAAAAAWASLHLEPLLDLGLADGGVDVAAAVVRTGLELLGPPGA
jgi:nicotinate-nucleotide--dimethylbenzimidazole phosphoribosyltransferase